MKPSAILINTCRGPVVDADALYDALVSDRIRGAELDVMVEEPPAPRAQALHLAKHHPDAAYGGAELGELEKAFRNSFDNIERVARGEKPFWIVSELRD